MKRQFLYFAVAVAMLSLFATSCQKEETDLNAPIRSFKAVIDRDSKTHLGGGRDGWLVVMWDLGDEVMISTNLGKRKIFKATSISENTATLEPSTGLDDQNSIYGAFFRALYPASCANVNTTNGSMTLSLPMRQVYSEHSMNGSPMYAEYTRTASNSNNQNTGMFNNNNADAPTLRFKNLCSQLRLNIQASGSVKSIVVESTDNGVFLAGDFPIVAGSEINVNEEEVAVWEAQTTPITSGTPSGMHKAAILNCGNGVNVSSAKDFNIYLPVGEYNVKITVVFANGGRYTLNSTSPINFNRDHVKKLTLANIPVPDVTPTTPYPNAGVFAINTTDHVYIAIGNLMNTAGPNAYYEDSWRFAQHPYDMISSYSNGQTAWNRFSWSTANAGDDFGMKVNVHADQSQANADFLDWGVNSIKNYDGSITYDPDFWFTLSTDEWKYLLGQTVDGHNRITEHMPHMTECYGYAYILPEDPNFTVQYKYGNGTTATFNLSDFLTDSARLYRTEQYRNGDPAQGVAYELPSGIYATGRTIETGDEYAGIPCLVIYPDNFPANKVLSLRDASHRWDNPYEYFWSNHAYALSYKRYKELLRLGCAFLPLLGQGQGAAEQTRAEQPFICGYYWSRTGRNAISCEYLKLTHNNTQINVQFETNTRGNGNAVRLVTPAPADSRHTAKK